MLRCLRLALATVLLAAGFLVALPLQAKEAKADPPCAPYVVIGVRGSGETPNGFAAMGTRVGAHAQRAAALLPSTTVFHSLVLPDYAATSPAAGWDNFANSASHGADSLYWIIRNKIDTCPGVRIGLIGYSQGAMVIQLALSQLTAAQRNVVKSVLLLANPFSIGGSGYGVYVDKGYGGIHPAGGGGMLLRWALPADIQGRSTEVCITYDPVCDNPSTILSGSWWDGNLPQLWKVHLFATAIDYPNHMMYDRKLGFLDLPSTFGALFAARMGLPGSPPGGPTAPPEPGHPGEKPCPQVSSLAQVPSGAVVQTCDTGRMYKMVGGAPLWMTTCANGMCPGTPVKVTQAIVDAAPAYPWDGATAKDEAGNVFKFVGGAPIHLSSCTVGCGSPVTVPAGTLQLENAGNHLRQRPVDGATAMDEQGQIFKFVGGAPIHLSSCAVGCGAPVRITTWSVANLDHMNPHPADGATLKDEQGQIFKFVGGAPVHLSSCNVGCGSPVPITTWSVFALEHMQPYPKDGSTAKDEAGNIFKYVGGAPIHLANCAVGCGNPVPINGWSVAALDHMNPHPKDGSTAKDEAGNIFKFVGGAPIKLASCAVGCGNPVPINGWSLATLEHMRPHPADGATIRTEPGDIFKFVGGAPVRLASCAVGCGNPVQISGASVAGLDHMLPAPNDHATVFTEQGLVYKFAGGAPLQLSHCVVDCGRPLMVTQWSVDNREHMAAKPKNGTLVNTPENNNGTMYVFNGGIADLAGPCPATPGCAKAIPVNQTSVDAHVDATTNHGPAYGQLSRYLNAQTGDHTSYAGTVAPGYHHELPLGQILVTQEPGTVAIHQCDNNGDLFTSLHDHCEGAEHRAFVGYLYQGQPAGTVPLYRCVTGAGEHFDSLNEDCEGQKQEFPLGSVIAYQTLTRYYHPDGEHTSSATGNVPVGYHPEVALGMVSTIQRPGQVPLQRCKIGNDYFSSRDSACEGQVHVGFQGFIWLQKPEGIPAMALYRCTTKAKNQHFDTLNAACENENPGGQLGWVLARGVLSRAVRGTDHADGAGVLPAGYQVERVQGFLAAASEPGTRLIYQCVMDGWDHFPSTHPDCEGEQRKGIVGFLWTAPPAGQISRQLFRCRVGGNGDHFVSQDEDCEGATPEGSLGYVVNRL